MAERIYIHNPRLKELLDDIESLSTYSESDLIQAGGDSGNIVTIVLGITNNSNKNLIGEAISA